MTNRAELYGDTTSFGAVEVTIETESKSPHVRGTISGAGLDRIEFDLAEQKYLQIGGRMRKVAIPNLSGTTVRFVASAADWF